mmetsp:Transcript_102000/g.266219  ORF Transcript_102000/g.266219 Transcript_102000/m.266219 type:complete len:380 (+) Transcript_102000:137-1276(+)
MPKKLPEREWVMNGLLINYGMPMPATKNLLCAEAQPRAHTLTKAVPELDAARVVPGHTSTKNRIATPWARHDRNATDVLPSTYADSGLCTLASRRLRTGQDALGLLSHDVAIDHRLVHVLLGDVLHGGLRGVLLAVRRQALRDAHARAIELANDPLLVLRGCARRGRVDEVRSPPQRNRLFAKTKRRHDLRKIGRHEALRQARKLLLTGAEIRVNRARAAHCGDAALLGLLVDDADEGVDHTVVAELALHNAWAEALVHELTSGRLATLEVLADALGGPLAGLVAAAMHAELDELCDRVLFRMVVVGLHHVQDVVVVAARLPVLLAIITGLQLDDPDALARRAAILLDHARLELHRLLEALHPGCLRVVGESVLQADAH